MSLQERLLEEMKEAMRQHDEVRLSTVRLLRAAIHNEEIAQRKPLDDATVVTVISRQARQRQESIEAYRSGNRPELAEREEAELAILRVYLPEQLSHEEIVELATRAIREVGASGPGDLGKVMGRLMPQVRGKAEGGEVHGVVSQLLSSS